jgi:hypothetical protein
MDYKRWRSSINNTLGSPDCWRMLSDDLAPKGGILSRRWNIQKYLGMLDGSSGWCGQNAVTERHRHWETWRKQQDDGGIIWSDKEVD